MGQDAAGPATGETIASNRGPYDPTGSTAPPAVGLRQPDLPQDPCGASESHQRLARKLPSSRYGDLNDTDFGSACDPDQPEGGLTMRSSAYLDSLIAYEDMQRAGYPVEAEDALAAWDHGETYEPAWYLDLPLEIRREIQVVNAETEEQTATAVSLTAEAQPA